MADGANLPDRVLIIGVRGFLGRHLAGHLAGRGVDVWGTSRTGDSGTVPPGVERLIPWDGRSADDLVPLLGAVDGVVNLTGAPLKTLPWTRGYRRRLRSSRIGPAAALAAAAARVPRPLRVIQGSAVGYYGDTGDCRVTENSPHGEGFLSRLVRDWEAAARKGQETTVSLALARTGVVLGPDGGALRRLRRFQALGLIPLPGGGRQWVAWIHMEDYLEAVTFLLARPNLTGPVNLAAPRSLRFRDLAAGAAPEGRRALPLPVPAFLVRLVLGAAAEPLLYGQRVQPARLEAAGFAFTRPAWPPV